MVREILHVVVPAFPIALARVGDSRLRQRPVAIAPSNSERALLQCISSEAAAEGLFAGQPVFRARRICPSLTLIPPDPLLIAKGTGALADIAAEFSPLIEPASGRLFLDLTGSRRLFGPPRDVAVKLVSAISKRISIVAQAGTGTNKMVTKIAADAMPEPGVYDIFQGAEKSFLAPFPISVLPGIGSERETQLLKDLNLRRVQDLADLTVAQLRLAVGAFAPLLHERAQGIDRSPVQLPRRSTEIIEEAYLEQEENDDEILLAELFRLVEFCGIRLRRIVKQTPRISLTIFYADGVSEQGTLALPVSESLDLPLFAYSERLFHTTCRRRVRVKGMKLAFSQAGEIQNRQLDLFAQTATASAKDKALQETLDRLRERHGAGAVSWGRTLWKQTPETTATQTESAADLSEYRYHTLTTRGG